VPPYVIRKCSTGVPITEPPTAALTGTLGTKGQKYPPTFPFQSGQPLGAAWFHFLSSLWQMVTAMWSYKKILVKQKFITLGSIAIITYCNLNEILFSFFICYFFISINSVCYKKMVEPMVIIYHLKVARHRKPVGPQPHFGLVSPALLLRWPFQCISYQALPSPGQRHLTWRC